MEILFAWVKMLVSQPDHGDDHYDDRLASPCPRAIGELPRAIPTIMCPFPCPLPGMWTGLRLLSGMLGERTPMRDGCG